LDRKGKKIKKIKYHFPNSYKNIIRYQIDLDILSHLLDIAEEGLFNPDNFTAAKF